MSTFVIDVNRPNPFNEYVHSFIIVTTLFNLKIEGKFWTMMFIVQIIHNYIIGFVGLNFSKIIYLFFLMW